mmetsp:Transcript_102638/g.320889  ORF Transcript_102638/g.320889 Transcript_102638/m.320889 type:complete len:519 (-) Transcript_102638:17-1573(-)
MPGGSSSGGSSRRDASWERKWEAMQADIEEHLALRESTSLPTIIAVPEVEPPALPAGLLPLELPPPPAGGEPTTEELLGGVFSSRRFDEAVTVSARRGSRGLSGRVRKPGTQQAVMPPPPEHGFAPPLRCEAGGDQGHSELRHSASGASSSHATPWTADDVLSPCALEGKQRNEPSTAASSSGSARNVQETASEPVDAMFEQAPDAEAATLQGALAAAELCVYKETLEQPAPATPRSERSAASGRSARSGGSSRSRRSGMTQAEVDEMRAMALEHNKSALREALLSLQTRWAKEMDELPAPEAPRLRQLLLQARNLREALSAVRAVEGASAGTVELALLLERCRARALLGVAIQGEDVPELRRALARAAALGLSVQLEQDLCDELEDRQLPWPQPTDDASASSGEGSEPPKDEASELRDEATAPPPQSRQAWWRRWLPWQRRRKAREEWDGEAGLLQAVQDHIKRGNEPLPHDLAMDLGLRSATPSPALRRGLPAAHETPLRPSQEDESPLTRVERTL